MNGVYRWFCSECGSPLISSRDAQPELYRLRIGTLDTPLDQNRLCIFLLLQRQSGNVSMTIYRNTMNVHDLKVCFNQILDDLIYLKQGDGIPP